MINYVICKDKRSESKLSFLFSEFGLFHLISELKSCEKILHYSRIIFDFRTADFYIVNIETEQLCESNFTLNYVKVMLIDILKNSHVFKVSLARKYTKKYAHENNARF